MTRRGLVIGAVVAFLAGCSAAGTQPFTILSRFGDYSFDGRPRTYGVHPGLDLAGEVGQPVFAPADGVVLRSGVLSFQCGFGVVIVHPPFEMATSYCHLLDDSPREKGPVARGEVIGRIGRTGYLPESDRTHLHFQLDRRATASQPRTPIDPEPYIAGCFDPNKVYPKDRLVLTWPLKC